MIDDKIGSYLQQMAREGRSPFTVAAHKVALKKFKSFTKEEDVRKIDREIVSSFTENLSRQDYTRKYKRSVAGILQQFFQKLEEQGAVLTNPVSKIKRIGGRPSRLPLYISKDDMRSLLDSTANTEERLVLEILYSTGMRASELAALNLSDVDFAGATVRIRNGKGRKDRLVPIGKNALQYLKRFSETMSRSRIYELVSRAGKRIGLKIHPHLLRHSFAVHLLEGGADIIEIQKMLGHAHLRTTQIYTRVLPGQLKKEFLRCHPAAGSSVSLPEIAPAKICESGRTGKKWKSAKIATKSLITNELRQSGRVEEKKIEAK